MGDARGVLPIKLPMGSSYRPVWGRRGAPGRPVGCATGWARRQDALKGGAAEAELRLQSAQLHPLRAVRRVLAVTMHGVIPGGERLRRPRRYPNGSIRPALPLNRANGYRKVLMDLQGSHLRCNLLRYRKSKVTERRGDSRMGVTGRRGSEKLASAEALLSVQFN